MCGSRVVTSWWLTPRLPTCRNFTPSAHTQVSEDYLEDFPLPKLSREAIQPPPRSIQNTLLSMRSPEAANKANSVFRPERRASVDSLGLVPCPSFVYLPRNNLRLATRAAIAWAHAGLRFLARDEEGDTAGQGSLLAQQVPGDEIF